MFEPPRYLTSFPPPTQRGTLDACGLVRLPRIADARGSLTFVEGGTPEAPGHLPFPIERVYYLYNVPGSASRGDHAHVGLFQFIVAMSGEFDITLDDGRRQVLYRMHRPDEGLFVCPLIWRQIDRFSSNAVCLVHASAPYDEADYLRSYDDFLQHVDNGAASS